MTENVTEWCKKEICWERAKKENWTFRRTFLDSLVPIDSVKRDEDDAKKRRKVENEVEDLKFIFAAGSDYWKKVYDWGKTRNMLTSMESDILNLIINQERTGRIPTDKQAKVAVKARKRLIDNGMPLQF